MAELLSSDPMRMSNFESVLLFPWALDAGSGGAAGTAPPSSLEPLGTGVVEDGSGGASRTAAPSPEPLIDPRLEIGVVEDGSGGASRTAAPSPDMLIDPRLEIGVVEDGSGSASRTAAPSPDMLIDPVAQSEGGPGENRQEMSARDQKRMRLNIPRMYLNHYAFPRSTSPISLEPTPPVLLQPRRTQLNSGSVEEIGSESEDSYASAFGSGAEELDAACSLAWHRRDALEKTPEGVVFKSAREVMIQADMHANELWQVHMHSIERSEMSPTSTEELFLARENAEFSHNAAIAAYRALLDTPEGACYKQADSELSARRNERAAWEEHVISTQ